MRPLQLEQEVFELMALVDRVRRRFLNFLKVELQQLGLEDITPSQAALVFHIGNGSVAIAEITRRGYHSGVSAAYNIKKLIDTGFLSLERPTADRRRASVRLTNKGRALRNKLRKGHASRAVGMPGIPGERNLKEVRETLARVEWWLTSAGDFGRLRGGGPIATRRARQAPAVRKPGA